MEIEIWSDVVCPWCAIGYARFVKALERFEHSDSVNLRFRSFELDPSAPPIRPVSMEQHLSRKYGTSLEEARRSIDHICSVAAEDGVVMNFETFNAGNTFDAHRLLHLGWQSGRQQQLKAELLRRIFTDGLAVGDNKALTQVALDVGLEPTEVREVLDSDRYSDDVREDEARAQSLGITGVPYFLIDQRFAIPGAQSTERFAQALSVAWERSINSGSEQR
ncbi:MAG: DsbA family oxidoreductase [Microthrixaceae bacterium]